MTTIEYARKIAELIDQRPRRIDLDKLLDEINARAQIAEGKCDLRERRSLTNEEAMEHVWKSIYSKLTGRNGRKKVSKQSLYARTAVELIAARPRYITLNKLLYEIDVLTGIAESERDIQQGRWVTHEQAMKEMWKLIYSKLKRQNHLKIIKVRQ